MQPPIAKLSVARRRTAAFLLAEVAMTLGIMSAVLIPLIGLYSVSLSTMRDAAAEVRSSLIAQRWMAQARMVPFDELETGAEQWFDPSGEVTTPSQGVYRARMEVEKGGGFLGSNNAARITVRISGPALEHREQVHSITVANLGQ